MVNQLYFIYRGAINTPVYIPKLNELGGNIEVIAAFPTRELAVEYALAMNFPTVIVERGYSTQGNDENNLISKYEYESLINNNDNENEYIEDDEIKLTGSISISGENIIGQTLTIETHNLNGDGEIQYAWHRSETGDLFVMIPDENEKQYILTIDDLGKYIMATVKRIDTVGTLYSNNTEPIEDIV